MTKLQVHRDSLEKDDEVFVVTTLGEGITKKKSARVVDVLRGAAKLMVSGEKTPRLVRFNDIQLKDGEVVQQQAPVPKLALVPTPLPLPVIGEPGWSPLQEQQVAVVQPLSVLTAPKSTFDIWLEMGEQLLEEQKLELAILDSEEQAIHAEEADMKEQIAIIELMLKDIPKRLSDIPNRKQRVQAQIDMMRSRLGR